MTRRRLADVLTRWTKKTDPRVDQEVRGPIEEDGKVGGPTEEDLERVQPQVLGVMEEVAGRELTVEVMMMALAGRFRERAEKRAKR